MGDSPCPHSSPFVQECGGIEHSQARARAFFGSAPEGRHAHPLVSPLIQAKGLRRRWAPPGQGSGGI